jgi:hypothetical protein
MPKFGIDKIVFAIKILLVQFALCLSGHNFFLISYGVHRSSPKKLSQILLSLKLL